MIPVFRVFSSQMQRVITAFTFQPQNITALWPALISHQAEGRRLSWLVATKMVYVRMMIHLSCV